jgi:hypothetical protein
VFTLTSGVRVCVAVDVGVEVDVEVGVFVPVAVGEVVGVFVFVAVGVSVGGTGVTVGGIGVLVGGGVGDASCTWAAEEQDVIINIMSNTQPIFNEGFILIKSLSS